MRSRLIAAEKELGNVELMIGEPHDTAQTAALLREAGTGTPVLAIPVRSNSLTTLAAQILERGHPMLVFSLPASGHDWVHVQRWQRQGHRVSLMPTGAYDELERALRLLRVIPMMRRTRILLFPPARGSSAARSTAELTRRLGVDVVAVDEGFFDELVRATDDDAVQAEADRWRNEAEAVIEPEADDISRAARISIALQRLVEREQAQAVAVGSCMTWLQRGFPCLGFARLRDAGLPAACEGDMDSLLTMLVFQYAFDLAGFQGNATFDTSRNALWTAHCTAPLKMEGTNSKPARYVLRSHSEIDGNSCVPEVHYRLGQTVTSAKLVNLDTMLVSKGRIVEVPRRSVHGCRTQIMTHVRDAATMAVNWSSAVDTEDTMTLLHRVVFFGDHVDSAGHLARLLGAKLVEEG